MPDLQWCYMLFVMQLRHQRLTRALQVYQRPWLGPYHTLAWAASDGTGCDWGWDPARFPVWHSGSTGGRRATGGVEDDAGDLQVEVGLESSVQQLAC
jgi:hypothetical protein